MSSLSTLPKGDSAWLLRKSIQRIMQQVSVLETNIGSSTTGNSANTQIIFNDAGTLRGDAGLTYNKTTDLLSVGAATITGDLTVDTSTLKVDSANNRVGIGTASPAAALQVVATAKGLIFGSSTASGAYAAFQYNSADVGYIGNGTSVIVSGASATDFGIGAGSGKKLWLGSNDGASFAVLDSSGNLGLGVTPSAPSGAYRNIQNNNAVMMSAAGDTTAYWNANAYYNAGWKYINSGVSSRYEQGSGHFWFTAPSGTAGNAITFTQAMTLTSGGDLCVGLTASAYKISAGGFVAAVDPSFTGTGGSLIGAMLNNDNTAPGLDLRRWTGTAGTHGTTYISTDSTGSTFFYNGQQASNTKATSLKMTLDASGNLLVGTTNTNPAYNAVNGISVSPTFLSVSNTTGVAGAFNRNDDGIVLYFTKNGTAVGNVSVTAGGTTFNSTSDYRLKENVQPLAGGLARVSALKPSIYKWKANGSAGEGFLAHELAEVIPLAVTGEKDAVNADGSIKAQSIDMSRVVPILVAAIQELTARVQTLETR